MKTTTPDGDPGAAAKLHELIEDISVAMLTTVTPDGTLHSRPMLTRQMKEERELWFVVMDDSRIATDLSAENAVNVTYAAPGRDRYVSVTGNASVVHDDDRLRELWDDSLNRYFADGLANPHLALLRVRVEYAEFWEGAGGKTVSVGGESRRSKASSDRPTKPRDLSDGHVKVDVREARASG